MSLATYHSTGLDLAKALGLATERLRSFSVHVEPDHLVEIRVTYFAERIGAGDLEQFERRFTLQEADNP